MSNTFNWGAINTSLGGSTDYASKNTIASDLAQVDKKSSNNNWMSFWFGNKEQVGAVQAGASVFSGAVGAWLGYENLQLAEESLSMQREQFAQNKAMANMEAALKLDARKRGLAAHGISSDVVNKYASQYQ